MNFSFANADSLAAQSGKVLRKDLKPVFQAADYRIANLETTLSRAGSPAPFIKYPFYAHKKSISILKKMQIDQVILANNHAMDYGDASLLQTIDKLAAANISHVGAGKDEASAQSPVDFLLAKINFGTIALSMVGRSFLYAGINKPGVNSKVSMMDVRQQSQKRDHLIVSLHWGREYHVYPSQLQINYARKLIKNGTRIVFGHHPHIPQALEVFRGGIILYSVGNMSFGTRHELQDHNILVFADFDRTSKQLQQIRVLPINGRYWENGHNNLRLSTMERESFLKRYLLMIKKLSPPTAGRATIKQGIMTIKIY